MLLIADDDVVHDVHIEQFSCIGNSLGNVFVLHTHGEISRRMIVAKNNRRSPFE